MNHVLISLYLLVGSIVALLSIIYGITGNNPSCKDYRSKSLFAKLFGYISDMIGWPLTIVLLALSIKNKV